MNAMRFLKGVSDTLGVSDELWSGQMDFDATSACFVWHQSDGSSHAGPVMIQWTDSNKIITGTSSLGPVDTCATREELASKFSQICDVRGDMVVSEVSYFTTEF